MSKKKSTLLYSYYIGKILKNAKFKDFNSNNRFPFQLTGPFLEEHL